MLKRLRGEDHLETVRQCLVVRDRSCASAECCYYCTRFLHRKGWWAMKRKPYEKPVLARHGTLPQVVAAGTPYLPPPSPGPS